MLPVTWFNFSLKLLLHWVSKKLISNFSTPLKSCYVYRALNCSKGHGEKLLVFSHPPMDVSRDTSHPLNSNKFCPAAFCVFLVPLGYQNLHEWEDILYSYAVKGSFVRLRHRFLCSFIDSKNTEDMETDLSLLLCFLFCQEQEIVF